MLPQWSRLLFIQICIFSKSDLPKRKPMLKLVQTWQINQALGLSTRLMLAALQPQVLRVLVRQVWWALC